MELSTEIIESLQLAGENAHISDKVFPVFLERIYESLMVAEKKNVVLDDPSLSSIERGALKQAYCGLATFLLEAAKHDTDETTLGHQLEDCKFSPDRIATVTKSFKEKKAELEMLLSSTGHNPPHLVDVDWRLDYLIKDSSLEKVSEPTYTVSLKTEECGGLSSSVDISCSHDQLQDMVAKLRDACKSLERAANM